MQWRQLVSWLGVRPLGFVANGGDQAQGVGRPGAVIVADMPLLAPRVTARQRQAAERRTRAVAAVKSFLHDQVCDVETLRAANNGSQAAVRSTRYQHPMTGATWNGEGRQPQWLRDALLTEGWLLMDLRHAAQDAKGSH